MIHDNPIIKKRFEEKMKRWNEQSISILVSWAINNVSNTLNEKEKTKPWRQRIKLIEKRYDDFIDLYRKAMLENIPIPTSQPAPPLNKKPPTKKQIEASEKKIEELRQEFISEEDKEKMREAEEEYFNTPPVEEVAELKRDELGNNL